MPDDRPIRGVRVERELCLGAEYCTRIAPGAFAVDEQGIAVVIDPGGADDEALREAERTCPAGAVFLDD